MILDVGGRGVSWPRGRVQLGARERSGQELSERKEPSVFMQRDRQVHLCSSVRVRLAPAPVHSAAPLKCEITVSITQI